MIKSSCIEHGIPVFFSNFSLLLYFQALYEQQKKSQLCDLSLVVENVTFSAHKCVLAAHSDYFYALFDQGKQTDDAGSKVSKKIDYLLNIIMRNKNLFCFGFQSVLCYRLKFI